MINKTFNASLTVCNQISQDS